MANQRLHIAIVIPGFVIERDDPGLPAVVDLIERLSTVHECHVVALRYPPARDPYVVAGARVHPLGGGVAAGPVGRARILARGIREILVLHRRRRFDLIHALWADEPGAVASISGRLIRRPVVVSFLGGELARLPDIGYGAALGIGGRWTVSIALGGADLVTAGSGIARAMVLARRPSAPVALAPLGADVSRFRPADGAPAAATTILFVGSLEPVKDPAAALRVFAALSAGRPSFRLEMVGDGRLRSELEAEVDRLGVGDRVSFPGQMPRAGMPERYRSAALLLVTSRHEGQSMAAVEAAASGVPVVGTRVGVLPDLGDGARTVAIGDEAGLAEAAAAVLDDPAVAAAMGAAGRAAATARFDLDRTAADLLERYERLVTRG